MRADGSNQVRLTDHPRRDGWPAWSPDGKKLAFSSHRDGAREVYVMDIDGRNVVRLTQTGTYNSDPHSSPDGKQILSNPGVMATTRSM